MKSNGANPCKNSTESRLRLSKILDRENAPARKANPSFSRRYLDPKYSRWLSVDSALGEYIPIEPKDDKAKEHNKHLPGMGGVFNLVNLNLYHYSGNNPIKYTDPDGEKIIVGISTSDSVWGKVIGEHAFIMCIDDYDSNNSIMLDASGHYGDFRSADTVDGKQVDISVESYLNYWNTDEKLTTFELKMSSQDEAKIKDAVSKTEGRSWMSCADKASTVLNKNFSDKIKKSATPIGFLKSLNEYAKNNPDSVVVKQFDFRTKKEISTDDK